MKLYPVVHESDSCSICPFCKNKNKKKCPYIKYYLSPVFPPYIGEIHLKGIENLGIGLSGPVLACPKYERDLFFTDVIFAIAEFFTLID